MSGGRVALTKSVPVVPTGSTPYWWASSPEYLRDASQKALPTFDVDGSRARDLRSFRGQAGKYNWGRRTATSDSLFFV
jgi:hypothetical protein